MLLRAVKPWYNRDHEGQVEVGQCFEASEFRARELIRSGLALAAMNETGKIKVTADPPVRRTKRS